MKMFVCSIFALLSFAVGAADAKPSGSKSSSGYGTGSNPSAHRAKGHVRSNGTYVAPHARTNPNSRTSDNYNTKPNYNPHTGQTGKRVHPPQK